MTKITVSNSTSTNTIAAKIQSTAGMLADGIYTSNVTINSSAIVVGNVSIIPPNIVMPSITLGGSAYTGNSFKGILAYQGFIVFGGDTTWYNPYSNATINSTMTGTEKVLVIAIGAGGGAASNTTHMRGGGGGACVIGEFRVSQLPATVTTTVGLGGTPVRTTSTNLGIAGDGGNTTFHTITAYGGFGGRALGGGGGGGSLSSTSLANGGGPVGGVFGNPGGVSTYGGGGGCSVQNGNGGLSIYGGGGGGGGTGSGGNSFFGGGGGTGTGAAGISIFAGAGGNNGLEGSLYGGGGGANTTVANSGANGDLRVWVFNSS